MRRRLKGGKELKTGGWVQDEPRLLNNWFPPSGNKACSLSSFLKHNKNARNSFLRVQFIWPSLSPNFCLYVISIFYINIICLCLDAHLLNLEQRINPHFNKGFLSGKFHRPWTKESWFVLCFSPYSAWWAVKFTHTPENAPQAALCLANNTRDVSEDTARRTLLCFWFYSFVVVCSLTFEGELLQSWLLLCGRRNIRFWFKKKKLRKDLNLFSQFYFTQLTELHWIIWDSALSNKKFCSCYLLWRSSSNKFIHI